MTGLESSRKPSIPSLWMDRRRDLQVRIAAAVAAPPLEHAVSKLTASAITPTGYSATRPAGLRPSDRCR